MSESVRLTVLNSLPWTDTRLVEVPSCRDDVAVIDVATGEPVAAQTDRSVTDDGKYILSFGPVELPPMGRRDFDVVVPFETTNTDQFPDMPSWAAQRSVEMSSTGSKIQPNAGPTEAANKYSVRSNITYLPNLGRPPRSQATATYKELQCHPRPNSRLLPLTLAGGFDQ